MAIAYVGRAGSNSGQTQVSSFVITTTASIAAGDLIVVSVAASNVGDTSNLTSVTDSAGNTYVSAGFAADGGQNCLNAVWYAQNCLALNSGQTVTVTFHTSLLSAGEAWFGAVDDISGAATASVVDQALFATVAGSVTPWTTGNITTLNAADMLWTTFGGNQAETSAITQANSVPTSGWTIQTGIVLGGNALRTAFQVISATGTYSGGGTDTTVNNGMSCGIVAFKAAAGGGGAAAPAPAAAHGQWPNPMRQTQRMALTTKAHTVNGIEENDAVPGAVTQFYGEPTNSAPLPSPVNAARGLWPNPLRQTQRQALTTKVPGYNPGAGAGNNDNDLTAAVVLQFYGQADVYGVQQMPQTALVASTLVTESAQLVTPASTVIEQAQSALALSGAQIADPSMPVVASSALVESFAQLEAPATVQANTLLSETSAQILEPAAVQSNALLTETAQLVDLSMPVIANALLADAPVQLVDPSAIAVQANTLDTIPDAIVQDPSIPIVASSVLNVTGGLAGNFVQGTVSFIANTLLGEAAQLVAAATVAASTIIVEAAQLVTLSAAEVATSALASLVQQVVAQGDVLQASSLLAVTGTTIGVKSPVVYTISDSANVVYTLSDSPAPVSVYALTDISRIIYTVSDQAA